MLMLDLGRPEREDADIISYAAGHKALGLYANLRPARTLIPGGRFTPHVFEGMREGDTLVRALDFEARGTPTARAMASIAAASRTVKLAISLPTVVGVAGCPCVRASIGTSASPCASARSLSCTVSKKLK